MANLHLLFNHVLTKEQIREAEQRLRITDIVTLPPKLASLWSEVNPMGELNPEYFIPIERWLSEKAQEGDYVLVQGECGATYLLVEHCFSRGLVPIYATSEHKEKNRNSSSHWDDHVERECEFHHVNFRRYPSRNK